MSEATDQPQSSEALETREFTAMSIPIDRILPSFSMADYDGLPTPEQFHEATKRLSSDDWRVRYSLLVATAPKAWKDKVLDLRIAMINERNKRKVKA